MYQSDRNQAKKQGVIVRQNELIYVEGTSLETLLEMNATSWQCSFFTKVSVQQFEKHLEILFSQDTKESWQLAEDLVQSDDLTMLTEEIYDNEDVLNESSSAPVIRFINAILTEAVKERASDIHIETYEKTMVIRFRIDGILRPIVRPDKKLATLLISRVKVMAKLDIAEKRLPQDGRISLKLGGRNIDIRVSTLPSQYGERAVLRLLDKDNHRLSLDKLDISADDIITLKKLITQPNGIILITGPTGSGKSTTLYAILSALNSPDRNILTVEDPIEYELDGIGQSQVNTRVEMSFSRGLRAILRQDPDVVMVGEIRDTETAQIAVQASLTGHLVLSTLHTNSACGAVTRLRDMGVESFLLSSSLAGVVAQRLVKRLCPECRVQRSPTPPEARRLLSEGLSPTHIWCASGCTECNHSGYRGRLAIHELLKVTPELRQAIHNNASEREIETIQRKQNHSLLTNGLAAVVSGHTSLEEVLRVVTESNDIPENSK